VARDVRDADGVTWSCIQAFAGLSDGAEKTAAARVQGKRGTLHVVCTPSGGAQSVRLELPEDWETSLSNGELLQDIAAHLRAQGQP